MKQISGAVKNFPYALSLTVRGVRLPEISCFS
jgi:hypothetical protein